jgi:hypothetical protein
MTLPGKPSALIKPTLETRFHIDYEWWQRPTSEGDLRIYLLSHLPPEQRERIGQSEEGRIVDYIDPETGEVSRLDELRLAIQIAAQDPDFINEHTSLVDSVFRVFLRNNNTPLSPQELSELTGRSAETILKTFSGRRIYKGIRPYMT